MVESVYLYSFNIVAVKTLFVRQLLLGGETSKYKDFMPTNQ